MVEHGAGSTLCLPCAVLCVHPPLCPSLVRRVARQNGASGRWSDNGLLLTDPSVTLTFYAMQIDSAGLTAAALASSFEMNKGGTMRLGEGGLWSLVDTSAEYTKG